MAQQICATTTMDTNDDLLTRTINDILGNLQQPEPSTVVTTVPVVSAVAPVTTTAKKTTRKPKAPKRTTTQQEGPYHQQQQQQQWQQQQQQQQQQQPPQHQQQPSLLERRGGQLPRLDLGRRLYAEVRTWNSEVKLHIRQFGFNPEHQQEYPTTRGVTLTQQQFHALCATRGEFDNDFLQQEQQQQQQQRQQQQQQCQPPDYYDLTDRW